MQQLKKQIAALWNKYTKHKNNGLLAEILSPSFIDNPYSLYRKLHRHQKMFFNGEFWVAFRYQDVEFVLKDKRFAKDFLEDQIARYGIDTTNGFAIQLLSRMMLFKNPPDHTRLRRLLIEKFNANWLEQRESYIELVADQLIEKHLVKKKMDLMEDFAFPLSASVISQSLGLPEEKNHEWRQKLASLNYIIDPLSLPNPLINSEIEKINLDIQSIYEYIRCLCKKRRSYPKDDILSKLIYIYDNEGKSSMDEVIANILLILAAGYETTTNFMGNALLSLFRCPHQLNMLKSNLEQRMANAISELLRYETPVQLTSRVALENIEMGTHVVKKGEHIMVMIGAANRDPNVFSHPNELDISRSKIRNLSFGGGAHFCLGSQFARIETAIALKKLLQRIPTLRLDNIHRPKWKRFISIRGLQSLPASW